MAIQDLDFSTQSKVSEKEHIIISRFGSSLGKKSERLILKEKGQVLREVPFFQIEQVTIISSGVSLSTDVVEECVRHGIEINLLDYRGNPYAKLFAPGLAATVKTRRQQLLAFLDQRGIILAKAFVQGKLRNQVNTLKYFAKYRKTSQRQMFDDIMGNCRLMERTMEELAGIKGKNIDEVRAQLMSIEGRVATRYWRAVAGMLQGKVDFPGRENRGATDPVNSLLNYGYAVLETRVLGAILQAGLDPYAGFLHVDRPGKASLVYDLMEEFRQPLVDRVVIAMLTQGTAIRMDGDWLAVESKQALIKRIQDRLESKERFDGKKFPLRAVILRQTRRLAAYLRGENKYKPFVCGW